KHTLPHSTGRLYIDHLLYLPGRSMMSTTIGNKKPAGYSTLTAFIQVNPDVLGTGSSTVDSYNTLGSTLIYRIDISGLSNFCNPINRFIVIFHGDFFFFGFFLTDHVGVIEVQQILIK